MGNLFSDLGGTLTTVCAVGCACLGVITLGVVFFAVRIGGQFLPMISDLLTGGRGEKQMTEPIAAQGVGRSAGESIRQRAQLVKAQDPLAPPVQSQSFQSQAAPPVAAMQQRGEFPAFNPGQAAQPQPPASSGQTLLPPSRATGQFGAIGRQQPLTPQSNVPPATPLRGNYPAFNPPGTPGAVQPPAAPLGGNPPRPSLSSPRPVSPLDNTGQTPAFDNRFDTGEVPGLRNRRRRSRDEGGEIYDDEGGDDGFGGLGNLLGGF